MQRTILILGALALLIAATYLGVDAAGLLGDAVEVVDTIEDQAEETEAPEEQAEDAEGGTGEAAE